MDQRIYKLLKLLSAQGVAVNTNIAPIIDNLFPPVVIMDPAFNAKQLDVVSFIKSLVDSEYILVDPTYVNAGIFGIQMPGWFDQLDGSLLPKGEELFKQEDRNILTEKLNQSMIDTNESVRKNNTAMASLAQEQLNLAQLTATATQTQGQVARQQTKLITLQTWIFGFTALFTFLSLWFNWRSDFRNTQKDN